MTRKFYLLLCLAIGLTFGTAHTQTDGLALTAKPKNLWELGINVGHNILTGDVDWKSDFGVGLSLRKALDYTFSIRFDANYLRYTGEEQENNREVDGSFYGYPTNWLPQYNATNIVGDMAVVASLNQIKVFKKNKINPYAFAGLGVGAVSAEVNNGGADPKDVLDSRNFDDDWSISAQAVGGLGIGFLIGKKVSIAIEHKLYKVLGRAGDLLDGVEFQGTLNDIVATPSDDLGNYTNLRINFALGKLNDETQMPLWWVSPMDQIAEDLAEVKARAIFDDTDSDNDGVLDMVDQEADTPENCPVDTRGVRLDSDGDGLADCEDDEPYSPPGYEVNNKGIAQVPAPDMLDENDVNKIIDGRLATWTPKVDYTTDWFLPMIHFGNDKYSIKNSEYGKLANVATVMRLNPGVRVVASGYTDKRAGDCYNDVLSYNRAQAAIDYLVTKYGIDRNRFVLNWGGENNNLVPTNASNMMNRRVEFTVATTESEMGRPDCGVNSAGSGSGTRYSGNKEAGY